MSDYEDYLSRIQEWEVWNIACNGMRYWYKPKSKWRPSIDVHNGKVWVDQETLLTYDEARALAVHIIEVLATHD